LIIAQSNGDGENARSQEGGKQNNYIESQDDRLFRLLERPL